MEITARFNSTCPVCGHQIQAGTTCEWKRGQKARHITCPEGAPARTGPKKTGQLWEECPQCGREPVYMPLHLCDECWPANPEPPKIDTTCPEPYRRGIGQGFGANEDGD